MVNERQVLKETLKESFMISQIKNPEKYIQYGCFKYVRICMQLFKYRNNELY